MTDDGEELAARVRVLIKLWREHGNPYLKPAADQLETIVEAWEEDRFR
jgi:hypothetical protein